VRSLATRCALSMFVAVGICVGSEVHAGWINYNVVLDEPETVFIEVDHVAVGGVPTFGGGLVNWRVVGAEFPVIGGFGLSIDTRHEIFGGGMFAPHATDRNPNPNQIQTITGGPLVPGVTAFPLRVLGPALHPGPPNHFNWMQLLYMPTAVGTSRLSIQLDHTETEEPPAFIPEPSTLTLVGLGTLGLVRYGWRRRKTA
jgi:hypothetical protein